MVVPVSLFEVGDVRVPENRFSPVEPDERVPDADLSFTDRFDFRSRQDETGFNRILDRIIERGPFVVR